MKLGYCLIFIFLFSRVGVDRLCIQSTVQVQVSYQGESLTANSQRASTIKPAFQCLSDQSLLSMCLQQHAPLTTAPPSWPASPPPVQISAEVALWKCFQNLNVGLTILPREGKKNYLLTIGEHYAEMVENINRRHLKVIKINKFVRQFHPHTCQLGPERTEPIIYCIPTITQL